ncbi:MAG TPA: nitroreductase family protein [Firmicutes bacterium]|jgi:nitroreductase|nr:nitroreductase family protein [Bacillota bacterium]
MTTDKTKEPTASTSNVDVLMAIRHRRSIRRYTPEPIDNATLTTILQAGLCAPTAMNRRPFHFVVIKDKDTLATLSAGKKYAWMLSHAQAAIVICGDNTVEDRPEHLYADCFAATQNMLLAIHGLHLGGVWLGVSQGSEWSALLQETLRLPANIIPTAVISLGHPSEEKPIPSTWEPEKIHYEAW